MKKTIKIILAVCVVVVLAVGGAAAWGYYAFLHTEPLTEAELAELEVDWSVVTGGNWSPWVVAADGSQEWNPAKSFNDWLATVPEEDKAWGDLIDIRTGHNQIFMSEYFGYFPPDKAQWEALVPALDSEEAGDVYDQLIEILARPVMGSGLYNQSNPEEVAAAKKYGHEWADNTAPVRPEEEVEMMMALLPAIAKQKGVNEFVLAYAARKFQKGDADEFVRACQVSFRNAELAKEMPTLIGQLVKFSIQERVVEYIDWAIDQHADAFTDQQLAKLDTVLADSDAYALYWQGEAMMFQDTVRRLADENGSLRTRAFREKDPQVGRRRLGSATSLPTEQLHASAQRMIYVYHGFMKRDMAAGDSPDDLSLESGLDFYQKEKEYLGRYEQLMLEIIMPSLSRSVEVALSYRRYTNAVRFSIAAHRHKLRHGEFTESPLDIDKDLLDFEPMDPLLGVWLEYELRDDGLFIVPGYPEAEPGVVLSPRQYEPYEPIVDRVKPEVYDWEYPDKTPEEIEEMNQP